MINQSMLFLLVFHRKKKHLLILSKIINETIGISRDIQTQLWRILSAILWLGNVEFIDESPARVKDQSALEWAAYLLQVFYSISLLILFCVIIYLFF